MKMIIVCNAIGKLEDIVISNSYLQHRFITRFKHDNALKCLCKKLLSHTKIPEKCLSTFFNGRTYPGAVNYRPFHT